MKKHLVLILAAIALIFGIVFFFLNEKPSAGTESVQLGKLARANVVTFDVTGGNFFFLPNQLKVKKGDTVVINFKNDKGFHNFVLDEFGVNFDAISDGMSKTVSFVADKVGTFEFYCSVGSHSTLGMKGNLIVE